MKQKKMAGLVVVLALFFIKPFAQSVSDDQLTVPLTNPGKAYSLKVNIMAGSIRVVSYGGKEVVIDVTSVENNGKKVKFPDQKSSESGGMKRITSARSYEVTAKENDNTVTVSSANPNRNIHLNLRVPQNVKLTLNAINNGNIEVENINGELEVTNVSGGIRLTNISGSVVASTVNGNVTSNFIAVDPKAPMAFSTLNGNINVTLPADTKANLKLKSDRGDIYSDFDIDIDKAQSQTTKLNERGMYKLKMEAWVNGKINGGGPEILMKNMHGNIYVKKLK